MDTRRRRRRRASIAVALASTAGFLLAACSSAGSSTAGNTTGSSSGKLPHTLVFSPLSLEVPALKGLATGVQAYAKSKGWKVQLQDPNYSAGTQQTELGTVISSGVAGAIWVLSVDPS